MTPNARFAEAREAAGLSHDEAAELMGISTPCIRDIENYEEELFCVYSASEVLRFCKVLKITPGVLIECSDSPESLSATQLVALINAHCVNQSMTFVEFETKVGWELSPGTTAPNTRLGQWSVDCIKDICAELQIDWKRVVQGLNSKPL
jgi:DNA-binding XRE family transcriptional regulator